MPASTHLLASAAAVTTVGALVLTSRRFFKRNVSDSAFGVLAWNLLAAPFTAFNHGPPKCVQGHRNPAESVETAAQTAARYSLATEALLRQAADAVLLQELDTSFFDAAINPRASELLAAYEVAATTNAPTVGTDGPGTGVLLRRGGRLRSTGETRSVGGTRETGGTSKSATCVLVQTCGGQRVWLASIHVAPIKFNEAGATTLLRMLAEALHVELAVAGDAAAASAPPVVLGGDFNAEPSELRQLARSTFLGGLARVPGLGHTGLSSDFAQPVTIDHLLVSPGLTLRGQRFVANGPCSPYAAADADGDEAAGAPASVVGASDHVWQMAWLS